MLVRARAHDSWSVSVPHCSGGSCCLALGIEIGTIGSDERENGTSQI